VGTVFDFSTCTTEGSQVDESTRIRTLVDLSVAMQSLGLLETKEIKTTVIMGPQSSGKSAALNALLSKFLGQNILLAPSASGRCTKSPLFVYLYNMGEKRPLQLQMPNSEVQEFDSMDELRTGLATLYKSAGDAVTLKREHAYKLSLKSDVSFTFVDTPGPVIPENNDRESTSQLWNNYYESIINLDSDQSPMVVSLVDLSSVKGCIDSDPYIMNLKSSISARPEMWKNCSLMIVITHIDKLSGENRASLVSTCAALEAGMTGVKKVMFAVTQLKKIKSEKDDGLNGKTVTEYHTPLETLDYEKTTLATNPLLAGAKKRTGENLFIIGIENIANAVITELGRSIVTDQAFLNSLYKALDKRIDLVSKQISLVEGRHSLSSIGVSLYTHLTDWHSGVVLAAKISRMMNVGLREQAEKFFVTQIYGKELDEGTVDNPNGHHQIVKFVAEQQKGIIWRDLIFQILDDVCTNEMSLVQPAAILLSRSIQRIFDPYLTFGTVKTALSEVVDEFKKENLPTLHSEIQKYVRDMKEAIAVKPALAIDRVKEAWPVGSKFIEACRFDKKEPILIRDVLLHLDTLLDLIEAMIAMKLMVFKKNLAEHISSVFSKKNDPIPEMTPEARKILVDEKAKYEAGKCYIQTFHPSVGIVKAVHSEPDKKKTKIGQAFDYVLNFGKNKTPYENF